MGDEFAVNGIPKLCGVVSVHKVRDSGKDEWWKYPESWGCKLCIHLQPQNLKFATKWKFGA